MSFRDRLHACNLFQPADYLPFVVEGEHVGLIRPEFAALLAQFHDAFDVSADQVQLSRSLQDAEQRTLAVDRALRELASRGAIAGWRDEPYPVAATLDGPVLFHMERAAIPRFGIWASGIHVNGFVREEGALRMWVGRRSPDKFTAPNKLDQIVAGGRSAGYGILQTLLKEAEEEAGIAGDVAARARPTGAISYCTERSEGLRRDILFIYDLELPRDFQPVNHDGEIAEFQLWPISQVVETVRSTDNFKFNCALVVIDFLIRHGVLTPDEEDDYLELVHGLRAR